MIELSFGDGLIGEADRVESPSSCLTEPDVTSFCRVI
jgi:hypothetical protein